MKLKICGMKYPDNILDVSKLKPDYMGFIFFHKSLRHVDMHEIEGPMQKLPEDISKVGVFVNHPYSEVIDICRKLKLNFVQLHGNETPDYVSRIKDSGTCVIKVFHMGKTFDWNLTKDFSTKADFFLFDTSTQQFGGSGQKFDWAMLDNYHDETPFFLSGGIDIDDIPDINKLNHPQIWGIDINSRMESSPAFKNINRIQTFINELKI